jgi:2-iminobutanoate/2-iminopropanoate deaminase
MKFIETLSAPRAIGPYSQAVEAGNMVFLSGQIPLRPETGELVTSDIRTETKQVLSNLRAVIEAAGLTIERVARTTIYLVEMSDFQAVNEEYATFFGGHRPARATVQVTGLPKGARVEIDAICVRG